MKSKLESNNKVNPNIKFDLYTLNDFSKYKLCSDLSLRNTIVFNTPDVFFREDRIKISSTKKIIKQVLEDFLQRIFMIIPKENQKLLLNNIDSLVIKSDNDCFDLIDNISFCIKNNGYESGYYDTINNEINVISKIEYYIYKMLIKNKEKINYKDFIEQVLSHELLHMASSFNQNGISYSGFSRVKINNDNSIGTFINEGYTEVLLSKIYSDKNYSTSGYKYEKEVAYAIEKIIGYEKMSSLYFNADFIGLTNELSKYSSIEDVKDFIDKLDRLEYLLHYIGNLRDVIKEIVDLDYKTTYFLIDLYIKKLKLDITKNDEIIEKTIEYSKKIVPNILVNFNIEYDIDVEQYLQKIFYEHNLLNSKVIRK